MAISEVSQYFTGVALELTPAPHFEKKVSIDRVKLRDLWSRLSGFRPYLVQLILLSFFLQAIGLISPLVNQLVIDDVISGGDRDLLLAVAIGFGSLILIQTVLETLRGFLQLHAGQRLSIQLSGNLLKHLLRLPSGFYERRHIGDILSRFSSLGPAQSFLTSGVVAIVLDAFMVIPVAVVMALYSPLLSLVVVVNLFVILAVRFATFPRLRRFAEDKLNLAARTDSVFLETVRGARAIKIAGRESERHGIWQNAFAEEQNVAFQDGAFRLWGASGTAVWLGMYSLVMLCSGALLVMGGSITLGMFFAFQSYALQFSGRITSLINAFFTYRMLGLHLERLADIIHADVERGLDKPSLNGRPLKGDISFHGVGFRYGIFDPWVLKDATLNIRSSDFAVIMGPSGGGKSTLLKLAIGLHEPDEGDVKADGLNLNLLGVTNYRRSIGVVMQDDQLLSGTIADNVSFFATDADMEEVERVCRLAFIHDDIVCMPMGYHSLVGDMGSILSGGQKQRIILARALYKQPKILFIDEGTANLDSQLENAVLESLSNIDMTVVMVAHRPAALKHASRAFVVEHGTIRDVTADLDTTSSKRAD